MKHFQIIEKKWKSTEKKKCIQCGKEVTDSMNHFLVQAHWVIKKKPDNHYFCSTTCLGKWCADDEDNE